GNMGSTRELAEFVVKTNYRKLPREAVQASKACLLDWLGVAIGGSKEPVTSILVELVKEMGGKRQATVIGRSMKTSVLNAALVNGTMSHVLDYDDLYHPAHLHPSATLFPAILAVAERDHLSGKDVIAAFVLGFETEARIGEVKGAQHLNPVLRKGWHPTPCLGVFGAAAGAGKLLGLTAEQTVNALGIACTKAAGMLSAFGTMSKSLQVGKSAFNGLLAAELARKGYTGPTEALEGDKGFYQVYIGAPGQEQIVADLGKDYRVVHDSFKLYASCGCTHAALDAVLELRRKHQLKASEIATIHCQVWPLTLGIANNSQASTGLEGKFSVQYCVGVALTDGQAGDEQFGEARVQDPEVRNLMAKVRISPNEAFDDRQAIATITTRKGERFEHKTDCVKGNPDNPVSREALEGKFRSLSSSIIGPDNAEQAVSLISALDKLDDINSLTALLGRGSRKAR
ncbi:MAG: MmgE/PrpD family protein, partial [Chloroflexota bacterium]